jgi:hypothetical protein
MQAAMASSFCACSRPARLWRRSSALLLGIALIAGCQPAMTQSIASSHSPKSNRPYTGTVADWPLFFNHHLFGVACFDTQTCRVVYNDFEFGNPEPTRPLTALSSQAYDSAMTASYGPVARTLGPAEVRWRCKDGTELQAKVDIAEIFADGTIHHDVPRDEIPEEVSMGSTHIMLEVNDRTLNVYTRTMIPTKQEQVPGNRFSAFRNDLMKVYSRTY